MRLIFLGDVVGRSGREAVYQHLPVLREALKPDVVVVNGENAAHGFGISEDIFNKLREAGADVVTLGNHAFDQREALIFIEREERLIRPVNWPKGCPGRGATLVETAAGRRVLVVNAMGRVMVEPMLDDPFPAVDRELESTLKQRPHAFWRKQFPDREGAGLALPALVERCLRVMWLQRRQQDRLQSPTQALLCAWRRCERSAHPPSPSKASLPSRRLKLFKSTPPN